MEIKAFDPVANENALKSIKDNQRIRFIDDQYQILAGADALAVATDWNQFKNPDFSRIKELMSAPVIFDGRNLYSQSYMQSQGFKYFTIGRPA